MVCKIAFIRKLLNGSSYTPPPPANTVAPTLSGNAVVGSTLTGSHGTYDISITAYEYVWQVAASPYVNWTDISGATSLTYVLQSSELTYKVRFGERVMGNGRWSSWSYSTPTGIVASTLPSAPTINTAATPSPTSGIQVGDTITITAPSITSTGTTDWWIAWVRDGVASEAFATEVDTFPLSYVVQTGDLSTTFVLRTYASNAAGTTTSDYSNIGPVTSNSSGTITDLGSADATASFIESFMGTKWVASGTATRTLTATSPDDLITKWNAQVLAAPMTERWEITLDWDGLALWGATEYPVSANGRLAYVPIYGPTGSSAWKDVGGWVKLKSASGKRAGFTNQVMVANGRGIIFEDVDFGGRFNTATSTKPAEMIATQQASLRVAGTGVVNGYTGEGVVRLYNCRVGRYASTLSFNFDDCIFGLWMDGTCEQIDVEKCSFAGCYSPLKAPARRGYFYNIDMSHNLEDICKTYPNTKSGYISCLLFDKVTVRDMVLDPRTEAYHADLVQHGSTSENHLGHFVVMRDCYVVMDHKYANSGTGGTQGFLVGNYPSHANNLHVLQRVGIFVSAPNAMSLISPDGEYCSYLDRVTLGRCGITPSMFGTDTNNKDWTPGTAFGVGSTTKSGTNFKVLNSIVGKAVNSSRVQHTNTTVVDWTVGRNTPTPETVFNGAVFERAGVNTSNGIANKFGYLHDTTTQANFITWVIANLVPQGAYASLGAPAPTPSDFSAPTLG